MENSDLPVPPAGPHELWDRQTGETDNAFALFQLFLESGPDSCLKSFAELAGKSVASIYQLSYRHQWSERAAAWRSHLAHLAFNAAEKAAADQSGFWSARQNLVRQHEWEHGQIMSAVARRVSNQLIENPESKIPIYAISTLFEAASKLMRRASKPDHDPNDIPHNKNADLALAELHKAAKIVYADYAAELAAKASQPSPENGKDAPPCVPISPTNNQPSAINSAPPPPSPRGRGLG